MAERCRADLIAVLHLGLQLACGRRPDAGLSVQVRGDETLAMRAERRALHDAGTLARRTNLLAGPCIPQNGVIAGGKDPPAVVAESDVVHIDVCSQDQPGRSGLWRYIPNPRGIIGAGGD